MSKFWYALTTFAESVLSVFGLRGPYEQPSYQVAQRLAPGIEMRSYVAGMAVETAMAPGNEGAAFGRLFRYISGANAPKQLIPMTAPVAEQPKVLGDAAPMTMRFFLPKALVATGVPQPTDPSVHIVAVPPATLCVIRFSGVATAQRRDQEIGRLRESLGRSGKPAEGPPVYLAYDPPFALPFLRRNEVGIPCH